jgi:PAS domain S-box-containing protein
MQSASVVSILVVEDESIIAFDLSHILQKFGYGISAVCHTISDALAQAAAVTPDLALVDISLRAPEDGIILAGQLRYQYDIPVVFLTANIDAGVIQRALDSDAFGYLVKPFNEHMLRTSIEMALRRHRAEEQLKASEERYRTLYESMSQGVTIRDANGRILALNPAAARIFGMDPSELVGTFPTDDFRLFDETGTPLTPDKYPVKLAVTSGKTIEDLIIQVKNKRDNRLRWHKITAIPQMKPGDTAPSQVISIFEDITEKHLTELALRDSEYKYRLLAENAIDVIWQLDLQTMQFIYISPSIYTLRGLTVEEAMQEKIEDTIDEQGLDLLRVHLPERLKQYSAGKSESSGQINLIRQRHHNGNWIWVEITTSVIPGEYGEPRYILGVSRSADERVHIAQEIQKLNADLERRVFERTAELENALKELETFAYSVSHDLKTPLRAIDGFSQILLEDYSPSLDAEGQEYLRRVRRATSRMGQLIDDLLAYSRLERRDLILGPVNLIQVVDHLLAENKEEISQRNIDVQINLHCPEVIAEPQGLIQALHNLLENALKFSASQTLPRIEIGSRKVEDHIRVWVKDNGIGFDMRYHDQIFDIFKRLHRGDEYAGTGVGLAIVRKAMQRVGGSVWAESAPGLGATFFLDFPV